MEGTAPPPFLLWKLGFVSLLVLAIGSTIFVRLQRRFYEHL